MSEQHLAINCKLYVADGDDDTPVLIAGTRNLTPPALKRKNLDFASTDQENDWMQSSPGLREADKLKFQVDYSSEMADRLATIYAAKTLPWHIKITTSEGDPESDVLRVYDFSGYLDTYNLPLNPEAHMLIDCEVKVSGEVTFTAGEGS
jgi:hypothetical protein